MRLRILILSLGACSMGSVPAVYIQGGAGFDLLVQTFIVDPTKFLEHLLALYFADYLSRHNVDTIANFQDLPPEIHKLMVAQRVAKDRITFVEAEQQKIQQKKVELEQKVQELEKIGSEAPDLGHLKCATSLRNLAGSKKDKNDYNKEIEDAKKTVKRLNKDYAHLQHQLESFQLCLSYVDSKLQGAAPSKPTPQEQAILQRVVQENKENIYASN